MTVRSIFYNIKSYYKFIFYCPERTKRSERKGRNFTFQSSSGDLSGDQGCSRFRMRTQQRPSFGRCPATREDRREQNAKTFRFFNQKRFDIFAESAERCQDGNLIIYPDSSRASLSEVYSTS